MVRPGYISVPDGAALDALRRSVTMRQGVCPLIVLFRLP